MAFQYILFNKPFKVLSQFSPDGEKETLANYLKGIDKDIYPVGRLDYDSEGLLLLTNDKQLNHRLTEPKFAHKRTYWVQVDGDITQRRNTTIAKRGCDKTQRKAIRNKTGWRKKIKVGTKGLG